MIDLEKASANMKIVKGGGLSKDAADEIEKFGFPDIASLVRILLATDNKHIRILLYDLYGCAIFHIDFSTKNEYEWYVTLSKIGKLCFRRKS